MSHGKTFRYFSLKYNELRGIVKTPRFSGCAMTGNHSFVSHRQRETPTNTEIMKQQIHTLATATNEDGCTYTDAAPVISAALTMMGTPDERQRFPRFTLICDEEARSTNSKATASKWIESIRPGTKCRVFRNAGKGVTIDCDDLTSPDPLSPAEAVTAPAPLEGEYLFQRVRAAGTEAGIQMTARQTTPYSLSYPVADTQYYGNDGDVSLVSRAKRPGHRGRPVSVIIPGKATDAEIRAKVAQFAERLASLQEERAAAREVEMQRETERLAKIEAYERREKQSLAALRTAAGGNPDRALPSDIALNYTNAADALHFVQEGTSYQPPFKNIDAKEWTTDQRAAIVVRIDRAIAAAIHA